MNIQNVNGVYQVESGSHIENQPSQPTEIEMEPRQASTSVSIVDDERAWMGMYNPTNMGSAANL